MKISIEWLTRRVDEAPTNFDPGVPHRTALQSRMAWQALKRRTGAGDELWEFANPANTWRKLGRCSGFAVVRDGEVVESVVTIKE